MISMTSGDLDLWPKVMNIDKMLARYNTPPVISRESAHIHESAHSLNLVHFNFLFFFKSNSQIRPPPENWFLSTWAPMGGFPREYGTCICTLIIDSNVWLQQMIFVWTTIGVWYFAIFSAAILFDSLPGWEGIALHPCCWKKSYTRLYGIFPYKICMNRKFVSDYWLS